MDEKDRIGVVPEASLYHDKDTYTIEVELPGVHKKDIELEASENGFCLTAPREDIEYVGCWILAHEIDPKKAIATFSNGLLKVTVPLEENFEGVKVPIK
ncbi:MAG: Hsp20/alpha crystallin family protein [Halobacteriota archaeon]|jgi:HSP20 family protein